MLVRSRYLSAIRPFAHDDLIKIITGIRRCGKSVILRQVYDELKAESRACLFLDFDLKETRNAIPDADSLIRYVRDHRPAGVLCYVFLDEVQNVDGWSEACRTLRLQNCSVFITGSNSRLLSGEFTKELSGRYVSFRVHPFVYREAKAWMAETGIDFTITRYLVWGGFPASLSYTDDDALKRYLSDLNDTIIYNDIENRHQIRKKDVFERITDFILVSNSRTFSARSVHDYLQGQGVTVTVPTVLKYLRYLQEAFAVNALPQYSEKMKAKMDYYPKLYNEDVSLNSIRHAGHRYDLTHNLENIVYNELIYMGYNVSVYNHHGREIDFRAEKNGKIYLIQVAYSVAEESTWKREFSAFDKLDNSAKKILITNDDIDFSTSTVCHYRLKDFLVMDEL